MHGYTKFNHSPNKEQYRIVRYNMTGRLMYIPKEIASNFGHAETLGEGDLNTVKGRISDFSTVSILKILSQLRAGPKTFGNLYTHSGIRFKRSYIKYLHLCIKYGFLDRKEQSPRSLLILLRVDLIDQAYETCILSAFGIFWRLQFLHPPTSFHHSTIVQARMQQTRC